MTARITFYFDFVSPNSYIAARGIDDIAAKHTRAVDWRPVSLFHVWDTIDHYPLGKPKAKARYLVRDFKRSAEIAGLALTMPKPFPLDADLARRSFYRIAARDPELARAFALAVFDRYWAEGEDISTPQQIAANTAALGGFPKTEGKWKSQLSHSARLRRRTWPSRKRPRRPPVGRISPIRRRGRPLRMHRRQPGHRGELLQAKRAGTSPPRSQSPLGNEGNTDGFLDRFCLSSSSWRRTVSSWRLCVCFKPSELSHVAWLVVSDGLRFGKDTARGRQCRSPRRANSRPLL